MPRVGQVSPGRYITYNNKKILTDDIGDNRGSQGADSVINGISIRKQWWLQFQHLSSGERVNFHGFLTQFSDNYDSDWNDESVFGRMDNISTFKRTSRTISVAWDVPASSELEAKENISTINKFVQFLYPTWQKINIPQASSQVSQKNNTVKKKIIQTNNKNQYMVSSPLMRIRFTNLIHNSETEQQKNVIDGGLICKVNGTLSVEPDFEAGFFASQLGMTYPQVWKLSCNLSIYHTHTLGFSNNGKGSITFGDNIGADGRRIDNNFPYPVIGVPPYNV